MFKYVWSIYFHYRKQHGYVKIFKIPNHFSMMYFTINIGNYWISLFFLSTTKFKIMKFDCISHWKIMAQIKKNLFKIGPVEGDSKLSMYLLFLAIVYPWRREGCGLHFPSPRMLCAMFSWKWPSCFGEYENLKHLG